MNEVILDKESPMWFSELSSRMFQPPFRTVFLDHLIDSWLRLTEYAWGTYGTIWHNRQPQTGWGSFHLLSKTMYDSMIFFRHSSLDFPKTPKHDNERIVTTGMGDHLGSKKSPKNHKLHSNRLTPPRTVFIKGGLLGSVLAVRFVFTIVSSHSWKKGTNWIESFEKAGGQKSSAFVTYFPGGLRKKQHGPKKTASFAN